MKPASQYDLRHAAVRIKQAQAYRHLQVLDDPSLNAVWCVMRPHGRPCFTPELLNELRQAQRTFQTRTDLRYQILTASDSLGGIFNLGGDLELFQSLIESQDREHLWQYMSDCVDLVYNAASSPLISVALVKGDALGGGFEAALAQHTIVAERQTRMGFPERLFNMFPGMGAYTFLRRRLPAAQALRIIDSARTYSAEELYAMGVVDILADTGKGDQAVYEHLNDCQRYHNARASLRTLVRTVEPVSRDELMEIGSLWVDTALKLTKRDLSYVQRLARSQHARVARQAAATGTARAQAV